MQTGAWRFLCALMCLVDDAMQIEHKMAAKIVEEEEKRMFFEMNEQERTKSMQRWGGRNSWSVWG